DVDEIAVPVAPTDEPAGEQDLLKMIEARGSQDWIPGPRALAEVAGHDTLPGLGGHAGEGRRDDLCDGRGLLAGDPALGTVERTAEARDDVGLTTQAIGRRHVRGKRQRPGVIAHRRYQVGAGVERVLGGRLPGFQKVPLASAKRAHRVVTV